jgi:hypothetical protein
MINFLNQLDLCIAQVALGGESLFTAQAAESEKANGTA